MFVTTSTTCHGCGEMVGDHELGPESVLVFECAALGCSSPQHVYVIECLPEEMEVISA